ncbi:unnamed protein product [Microthlaspi erraticum]|uniref:Uncharacterized protein n=1 Tax=Microthlaspi erraticum TaxID=1685480 RepID=A0A6D2KJ17_9BRAS|nr:unnamed protein product [Microthlaspi erraticum]
MGHEEHGGTWHMDAAQLDTQRKKEEAILKTSSTVYSTNRSSSSTRPAKLQLDRAEKSTLPEEIVYAAEASSKHGQSSHHRPGTKISSSNTPWFRHIANFLAAEYPPPNFFGYRKKKFLRDVRRYYWDEPYLYKKCSDGMFRRCIPEEEVEGILFACHSSSYAGHFATYKTVSKVYKLDFGGQLCLRMLMHSYQDVMLAKEWEI